ncbi:hypothetical protein WOLCODRAFT_159236 [Wolfiporia cocos MD-104 SS10]|uniref:Uncharacterized protein n=1 Tax=Wolfiporia cocos (strain MD-104) TaxID=742152 RepID=A0A2H3JBM4_WOLCO|nr:hypothetical protein WOLCODRAFT_159236 [Wolfiporia cocos MD-104 SS10]
MSPVDQAPLHLHQSKLLGHPAPAPESCLKRLVPIAAQSPLQQRSWRLSDSDLNPPLALSVCGPEIDDAVNGCLPPRRSQSGRVLVCAGKLARRRAATVTATIFISHSTRTLFLLYVLNPHGESDAGDLFSLVWCPTLQTLYFGCQDTSLQWYTFPLQCTTPAAMLITDSPSSSGSSTPARRAVLQVPPNNVIYSAHYGYTYCMALVPSTREGSSDPLFGTTEGGERQGLQLVTGSGDETVKLWQLAPGNPIPILAHTFECCMGTVLTLAVRDETVYAECPDGHVKVWDLETRTFLRSLIVVENIFSLNASFQSICVLRRRRTHGGIILSSIVTALPSLPSPDADDNTRDGHDTGEVRFALITGANDDNIKLWEVEPSKSRGSGSLSAITGADVKLGKLGSGEQEQEQQKQKQQKQKEQEQKQDKNKNKDKYKEEQEKVLW